MLNCIDCEYSIISNTNVGSLLLCQNPNSKEYMNQVDKDMTCELHSQNKKLYKFDVIESLFESFCLSDSIVSHNYFIEKSKGSLVLTMHTGEKVLSKRKYENITLDTVENKILNNKDLKKEIRLIHKTYIPMFKLMVMALEAESKCGGKYGNYF